MGFNLTTLFKIAELVMAIIIYWMHYNTYEADNYVHVFVIMTTFAGFLIVLIGNVLGHITGNANNRTLDIFYCVAGAALYIASGSLTIQHFNGWRFDSSKTNLGLTKGSLAIIQGAIFIVDGFFSFRSQ
uniref:Putative members of chemokine-like factor super family n=1 Tax=Triatoma infestans TaxID=30076 RepID=A0A023F8Q0_TRIIF